MASVRKKRQKDFEVFSLAFLDCICCGFGAMILLFVLTISQADRRNSVTREKLEVDKQQVLAARAAARLQRQAIILDVATAEALIAELVKELGDLDRALEVLQAQVQNEDGGKKALLTDIDELKRQIAALQTEVPDIEQLDTTAPIGIPIETNYVAFVIDTSGSMRDPNTEMLWSYVIRGFDEVIRGFPQIKGVQFLDADGRFILGQPGRWITDSPSTRDSMLNAVKRYRTFSNSNPVPGIVRAFRTLHDPADQTMKMGIFIFGDEFTETADRALADLDRLNPADADGTRKVTINAMGFPTLLDAPFSLAQTGVKFSNLMRELTFRHGGAFVVKSGD